MEDSPSSYFVHALLIITFASHIFNSQLTSLLFHRNILKSFLLKNHVCEAVLMYIRGYRIRYTNF